MMTFNFLFMVIGALSLVNAVLAFLGQSKDIGIVASVLTAVNLLFYFIL